MFDKKFEDRLAEWQKFREDLEFAKDPLSDVIKFYSKAPLVSIHTDPWDNKMWPTPWELINENQYCDFCLVLGMCYSLQLTERFKESKFEIHIGIDKTHSATYYLLYVDNKIIGWNESYVDQSKLPKTIESKKIYTMPTLH